MHALITVRHPAQLKGGLRYQPTARTGQHRRFVSTSTRYRMHEPPLDEACSLAQLTLTSVGDACRRFANPSAVIG